MLTFSALVEARVLWCGARGIPQKPNLQIYSVNGSTEFESVKQIVEFRLFFLLFPNEAAHFCRLNTTPDAEHLLWRLQRLEK